MDEFQKFYEEHQARKKDTIEHETGVKTKKRELTDLVFFRDILMERRSQRIFNNNPINDLEMEYILESIRFSPSSCNRQAIYVIDEQDIWYLETTIVGAKNWLKKANRVLMIFADKSAYKSPNEKAFMPYLDAGFVGQSIYLMCEAINVGCCFVNPNIREENKPAFVEKYGDDYFCGLIALGHYDKKAIEPPHRDLEKVIKG